MHAGFDSSLYRPKIYADADRDPVGNLNDVVRTHADHAETHSLAALTEAGSLRLMPSFIPYHPIWASSSPEGKDSFDTRDEECLMNSLSHDGTGMRSMQRGVC